MRDLTNYAALIERVEQATGPDYRPTWHPGWTMQPQDCACPPNTFCGNVACLHHLHALGVADEADE